MWAILEKKLIQKHSKFSEDKYLYHGIFPLKEDYILLRSYSQRKITPNLHFYKNKELNT